MSEKEPRRRKDQRGKWSLKMAGTILEGSFNTKKEAEAWGKWNNFGDENPYEIVTNKS